MGVNTKLQHHIRDRYNRSNSHFDKQYYPYTLYEYGRNYIKNRQFHIQSICTSIVFISHISWWIVLRNNDALAIGANLPNTNI